MRGVMEDLTANDLLTAPNAQLGIELIRQASSRRLRARCQAMAAASTAHAASAT